METQYLLLVALLILSCISLGITVVALMLPSSKYDFRPYDPK